MPRDAQLVARVLRLVDHVQLPQATRNWLRSRVNRTYRDHILRTWAFKLEDLKKHPQVIKNKRVLSGYLPAQVQVGFRPFQERHNANHTSGRDDDLRVDDGESRWGHVATQYFLADEESYDIDVPSWLMAETATHQLRVHRGTTDEGLHTFVTEVQTQQSRFIRQLQKFCHLTDQVQGLVNALQSGNVLLEIHRQSPVPQQNGNPRRPAQRPVRLDSRRLTCNWLEYQNDLGHHTLEGMFLNRMWNLPNACLINAFLNCYAERYNTRNGKLYNTERMGPKWCFAKIHPGKAYPGDANLGDFEWTFDDAKVWLAAIKQSGYLYSKFGEQLDCYKPPTQDKRNFNLVFAIIIHDNHVELVTREKAKENLNKRNKPQTTTREEYHSLYDRAWLYEDMSDVIHDTEDSEISVADGASYNIITTDPHLFDMEVHTLDEIIQNKAVAELVAKAKPKKVNNKDVYEPIRLLWRNPTQNIESLANELFRKHNWLPDGRLNSKRKLGSVILYDPNGKVPVHITAPDFGMFARFKSFSLNLEATHKALNMQNLIRKCASRELLSHYNEDFRTLMVKYNRSPPNIKMEHEDTVYELDQNKCYAGIIYSMEYFPVFSEFCTIKRYDHHEPESHTMYLVKKNNVLYEDRALVYGMHLEQDDAIEYFIRPNHLVKNPFREAIEEVAQSDLPDAVKKGLVNAFIGEFGRQYNTHAQVILCATEEEAHYRNRKRVGVVRKPQGQDLYQVIIDTRTPLRNGFLPIQILVYAEARKRLQQIAHKYKDFDPIFYHTDAVGFKSCPLLDTVDALAGNPWDPRNFGKLKQPVLKSIKDTPMCEPQTNAYMPSAMSLGITYWSPPNEADWSKDPSSMEDAFRKVDAYRGTFVWGQAGDGKTELLLRYIKSRGFTKYAVVCPSNTQANKYHPHGMTAYKFCGKIVGEDRSVRLAKTDYEFVIFEEFLQMDERQKRMIWEYIRHSDVRYAGNGDPRQLPPVELNWNYKTDAQEHAEEVCAMMFDSHILLQVPKRYNKEFVPKVLEMREDVWKVSRDDFRAKHLETKTFDELPSNTKFMVVSNPMMDTVNSMRHGDKPKFFVDLELRCIKEHEQGPHKMYKGEKVKVTGVTDERIVVELRGVTFWYTSEETVKQHYEYTYCLNSYLAQGDSYDDPVAIVWESRYMTRNQLNVMMSRCRNPNTVYAVDPPCSNDVTREQMKRKVEDCRDQDRDWNRRNPTKKQRLTDIDADWIQAQWEQQNHQCFYCPTIMSWNNRSRNNSKCTVDRKNSDFGHLKSNCVLCCLSCNSKKKQSATLGKWNMEV